MKVQIIFLFFSISLVPCKAQQLVWSKVYGDSSQLRYLGPVQVLSNGDILTAGGIYTSNFESQFIKFDSLGNLLWIKNVDYDTLDYSSINFFESIREEPDHFYVGGKIFQNIPPVNYDFIAKVDSSGDTLWLNKFPYFTFYNTTVSSSVLYDKSIITVGQLTTANDANILYRRLDSAGNLLWEKIYSNPVGQNANDIIELYDGSYLIIGQEINGVIFLLRININGDVVQTKYIQSNIQPSNGIIGRLKGRLLSKNEILVSGSDPGVWPIMGVSSLIYLNKQLDTINSTSISDRISFGPYMLSDSNIFFGTYTGSFPYQSTMTLIDYNFMITIWDSTLQVGVGNDAIGIANISFNGNHAYLSGSYSYATTYQPNYWLGKVENIGSKWIPDPCVLSPPLAGFSYSYNYPVLTLYDSSYSGLQYHDTVYTWEWTTSFGQGGNMDSTEIFLDTAITKSINVQLVISNWYECFDTVNVTLNFDPTGISEEKPLEVKVYPNPVSDVLHIEFSEDVEGDILFEIFDLHGTKLKSETFTEPGLRSSVSSHVLGGLSSGMYFYRISSGSQVRRGKVVLK